jgi:hypothetical protein
MCPQTRCMGFFFIFSVNSHFFFPVPLQNLLHSNVQPPRRYESSSALRIKMKINKQISQFIFGPAYMKLPERLYSRTRLKRHRFMRHLVYSVRHSVIPINSSLLTVTFYPSVTTTAVHSDTNNSLPFITLQPSSAVF